MDEQDNTPKPDPPEQPEEPLNLHTLSSMRSQIINPETPECSVSSILKTLARFLELTNHNYHHIILKLISDIAHHHPSLSQLALELVQSYTPPPEETQTRLAAELIDSLASISDKPIQLKDEFFVLLCLEFTSVQAKLWLLRNAGYHFWVQPGILFAVMFRFTMDPYPYVREASLEGLVRLGECADFKDIEMVKGSYEVGVELLEDMEDCVRGSAVRVVALWGQLLAAFDADLKTYWSNEVFAKLCSMARDMSMKVRVEAFNGLGKMETASKELLLQSLSKRVSISERQRETLGENSDEQFVELASSVAGALVHGLEDEFFEVRKSMCRCLCALTIISVEFASEALGLLMDALNDDCVVVRLQALETMHHMATNGCLNLQEKHMHMFHGVLVDNNTDVRYAGREILKVVKLKGRALFKSAIDGLVKNLDRYPQDEAGVFSALSHLGRNHKKFTVLFAKEINREIEATFGGATEFYSPRMAALLVLCISGPLLNGDKARTPPVMFSFAATFLGRIHCAFSDVMDRDALFAYLCEKSGSEEHSETDIKDEEEQSRLSEDDAPNLATSEMADSETQPPVMEEPKEEEQQKLVCNEGIYYTNYILAKFPDLWLMVQSGCTNEVLQSLSYWKEELGTVRVDSPGCADALAFASLYLRIMKLLAEVREHFLPVKEANPEKGELELKLGKLESGAKELMSRFVGFSEEEEFNVLELVLFIYTLRQCRVEICPCNFTFKRLTTTYSRIESLVKKGSDLQSSFIVQLGELLHETDTSMNKAFSTLRPFDECLKLFSLKQFVFHETISYTRAELSIPNNDSEHPLPFVPGLPSGIPCEITLHNISSNNRVWIRICMDGGATHHVFLDLSRFKFSKEVGKLALVAPYYGTPEADSFILKVCVSIESVFENVTPVQFIGGPRHELVLLCKEQLVYLSQVKK